MAEKNWKLESDYVEACNCDTVCPYVFLANPDQDECDVILSRHIEIRHFYNRSLDELNKVAVYIHLRQ
jgi:hypothetical protein